MERLGPLHFERMNRIWLASNATPLNGPPRGWGVMRRDSVLECGVAPPLSSRMQRGESVSQSSRRKRLPSSLSDFTRESK